MKTVSEIVEAVNKLPEKEREKVIEYLRYELQTQKIEEKVNQEEAKQNKESGKTIFE